MNSTRKNRYANAGPQPAAEQEQMSPLKPGVLESIDSAAGWIGAYVGGTAGNAHANALYEACATVERLAVVAERLERIARDTIDADGALILACDNMAAELAAFRGEQP